MNGGLTAILAVKADQRVDLEICEVEVDIDRVETDEEVDQGCLLALRDVRQQGSGDRLAGGEGSSDGEAERERLGVNITDIDTTLVSEENQIALTLRGDTDVILGVRRVRQEGLKNEVVESAGDIGNLWIGT